MLYLWSREVEYWQQILLDKPCSSYGQESTPTPQLPQQTKGNLACPHWLLTNSTDAPQKHPFGMHRSLVWQQLCLRPQEIAENCGNSPFHHINLSSPNLLHLHFMLLRERSEHNQGPFSPCSPSPHSRRADDRKAWKHVPPDLGAASSLLLTDD